MKYNAGLVHLNQKKKSNKMFVPGVKQEQYKIIYPVDELNYDIGGVPLLWLNANTLATAKEYYNRTYPYLTTEVADYMAERDFNAKVAFMRKQEDDELKARQARAAESFAIC